MEYAVDNEEKIDPKRQPRDGSVELLHRDKGESNNHLSGEEVVLVIVDGATVAGQVSYYDADGGSDILGYKVFDSKDDSSYTTVHDIYDGDQGTKVKVAGTRRMLASKNKTATWF